LVSRGNAPLVAPPLLGRDTKLGVMAYS